MILILSRKKKESEISVRPTENETDEEKNEAMWRDADTHIRQWCVNSIMLV